MTTREIKTLLHESIENINDEALLLAIKEIVERQYKPENSPKLAQWQKDRIEESRKQIKKGESFSAEEADDIVEKWLNE